jgi:hypothetical protein
MTDGFVSSLQGELSGDWLGQPSDNVNLKLDFTPSHEAAFFDPGAALKVLLIDACSDTSRVCTVLF